MHPGRTPSALRVAASPPVRDDGRLAIADALPDACWLYTPQDRAFHYVNPAFVRRWGGSVAQPAAAAQRWLERLHRDDRAAVLAALEGLADGEAYAIEYRTHGDDGEIVWNAETACFVDAVDGGAREVFGIARDITAPKRTEQALRNACCRKDEFLAILMHELRTPLQSILAASQALPTMHSTPSRIIGRQVQHLARLVDDLGESTRITQRKVHLQIERVDLRAVVHDAIDALQAGFDARRLHVRLEAPAEGVWVQADPARLAQVFNNLLHNAAKFSAVGGCVDVTVARPEGGHFATVSVRDHGTGIEREALDTVFELFAQAGHAPGHPRGGLGIGLSVVRSLVELHGGRVAVHSDGPGRGARFDVTLAAVEPPAATPPRRILIVEDNVDAAAGLYELLQLDGHAVAVAHDGRSALEQVARWQPDTVILDLGLPDRDGCDVARSIRASAEGRGPRLIALSGSGDVDRDVLLEAGFDHWLTKPALLSDLVAAIASREPVRPAPR